MPVVDVQTLSHQQLSQARHSPMSKHAVYRAWPSYHAHIVPPPCQDYTKPLTNWANASTQTLSFSVLLPFVPTKAISCHHAPPAWDLPPSVSEFDSKAVRIKNCIIRNPNANQKPTPYPTHEVPVQPHEANEKQRNLYYPKFHILMQSPMVIRIARIKPCQTVQQSYCFCFVSTS